MTKRMRSNLLLRPAPLHHCSSCGRQFEVRLSTRANWGLLLNDTFEKVRCPSCGHVEVDESIRVLGVFRLRTWIYLTLGWVFFDLLWEVATWLF